MLTTYFTCPAAIARLEATACGPHLDDYTGWLAERRYRRSLIRLYLFGIVPLGRWLEANTLGPRDFDHLALERFRTHRASVGQWRHASGKIKAAFLGAQRFHEYLVDRATVEAAPDRAGRLRPLHRAFEHWMLSHRGVREATVVGYTPYVSALLECCGDDPAGYTAAGLRRFVFDARERVGRPTGTRAATATRAFLRFLVATGQCSSTLPAAIPHMAGWRLAPLPSYLHAEQVERLIASCAECRLTARRDRAVLLLAWRLALRAGDIAGLELGDVDWQEARIRFVGKNRREIWLPLAQDVGDALVDYLQHERPEAASSRVFLKGIAPSGPLTSSCASSIVRRAIVRTGIDAPGRGVHLLRHSAATDMLRQGATLDQIGSVLRHQNLATTQLYAKVDQALLLGVAPPWPDSVPPDEKTSTGTQTETTETATC